MRQNYRRTLDFFFNFSDDFIGFSKFIDMQDQEAMAEIKALRKQVRIKH